jgi:NAD(P)-dependent dehydrogenase (short-subunit alcohol dehydrogenase family)
MGELQEVARTTTFLAGHGAAFINGQAIAVNGGLDWAP